MDSAIVEALKFLGLAVTGAFGVWGVVVTARASRRNAIDGAITQLHIAGGAQQAQKAVAETQAHAQTTIAEQLQATELIKALFSGFEKRVQDLETEAGINKTELSGARTELQQVRKDFVELTRANFDCEKRAVKLQARVLELEGRLDELSFEVAQKETTIRTLQTEMALLEEKTDGRADPQGVNVHGLMTITEPGMEVPQRLADRLVLVCDDNADARELLCLAIHLHGGTAFGVESAVKAIAAFQASHFDCLALDIGLPDMDGCALIRRLREIETVDGRRPTPALGISAFARAEDRVRALAAGFGGYLTKPVEHDILITAIVDAIERPRTTGPLA